MMALWHVLDGYGRRIGRVRATSSSRAWAMARDRFGDRMARVIR